MNVDISLKVLKEFNIKTEDFASMREELLPPNCVGVYVLKGLTGVLYVGMSVDIYKRVTDHLAGKDTSSSFYRNITEIDVFITENNSYADMLETYLIINLKPRYNIAKVPEEVLDIDELETMLHEVDEEIYLIEESMSHIKRELTDDYGDMLFGESCAEADLLALEYELEEAKYRRRQLTNKGARPTNDFSLFASTENKHTRNYRWYLYNFRKGLSK